MRLKQAFFVYKEIKLVKRFAFFPKVATMQIVWLENYYDVYQWTYKSREKETQWDKDLDFCAKSHYDESMRCPSSYFKWKKICSILPENPRVEEYLISKSPLARALSEEK